MTREQARVISLAALWLTTEAGASLRRLKTLAARPERAGTDRAGVLIGLAAPGTDGAFEALIYPVLGALLYATFLQVPFTALRAAFGDRRFLLAAFGLNFVVCRRSFSR